MRKLPRVPPTAEQLLIISRNELGTEVIRGAAGSGKTTTALLKLLALMGVHVSRHLRERDPSPVRVLVLTFNRTLRGYIAALAADQAAEDAAMVEVRTFAGWALDALGPNEILDDERRARHIARLGNAIDLPRDFLIDEVTYVLGRFLPSQLDDYLSARRHGRGASPRVDRVLRQQLLDSVIRPFLEWKAANDVWDWDDLPVALLAQDPIDRYDVIVVDETQDFTANQLRAIASRLRAQHSLVFVIDAAQRIYNRGFSWQEAGIEVTSSRTHRLTRNYRNTRQIARFALPLISGLPADDDATMPDFTRCTREGPLPKVLRGTFAGQMEYALRFIVQEVDLAQESVAFLHPLGGGWFSHVRSCLQRAGLPYAELTRAGEWPGGAENIGLSTIASAKGLEFDHVMILGLNREVIPHGDQEPGDEMVIRLRRLLAMGIGRAKKTVLIGYKPTDQSPVVGYLEDGTYEEVDV